MELCNSAYGTELYGNFKDDFKNIPAHIPLIPKGYKEDSRI